MSRLHLAGTSRRKVRASLARIPLAHGRTITCT
jgi:hypothetical protein